MVVAGTSDGDPTSLDDIGNKLPIGLSSGVVSRPFATCDLVGVDQIKIPPRHVVADEHVGRAARNAPLYIFGRNQLAPVVHHAPCLLFLVDAVGTAESQKAAILPRPAHAARGIPDLLLHAKELVIVAIDTVKQERVPVVVAVDVDDDDPELAGIVACLHHERDIAPRIVARFEIAHDDKRGKAQDRGRPDDVEGFIQQAVQVAHHANVARVDEFDASNLTIAETNAVIRKHRNSQDVEERKGTLIYGMNKVERQFPGSPLCWQSVYA
jgi:hypothetical protein